MPRCSPPRRFVPHAPFRHRPLDSGGFTLVEVMVAIAVIGVLLAITIVALRGVRASAQQGQSLSNLRANAQRFHLHAAERRVFPVAKPGTDPNPPIRSRSASDAAEFVTIRFDTPIGGVGGVGFWYFGNETSWTYYLASLGDDPATETWWSPSIARDDPTARNPRAPMRLESDYLYSHAFMAGPEYFVDTESRHYSMFRAIRPDEVAHPSGKGMLIERPEGVRARHPGAPAELAPTPMAFADGHASAHRLADARPAMPSAPGTTPNRPIIVTFRGSDGRDY